MSFDKLKQPASIAVVGASSDPKKVGYGVIHNIITGGFTGSIYPVNGRGGEILGKKCYTSLVEIQDTIDCAVIVVKRDFVLNVLKDCVIKKIEAVIVISAGFGETGEEGKKLQDELCTIARDASITMLGPNCLGFVNPGCKLNASFGQAIGKTGSIALISQSGALITAIQDLAAHHDIGFSLIASLGNKAALDEVEFLENLKTDDSTKVIAAYLENISRGQDFMRVAAEVSQVKPVIILKSGRTQAGAKAASSHTGSLAGADAAYNCAFLRTGVIRAESLEHLFDIATAFAYQPLPKGKRIGIVTNAGGPGIMMSDAIEMAGLEIAKINDETKAKLLQVLPPCASVQNPIDVLGDAPASMYAHAIECMLNAESVDALIVILTPQTMTEDMETARVIVDISKKYTKPVFGCFMGAEIISRSVKILRDNKIPQYTIPERAAKAMKEMVLYGEFKQAKRSVPQVFDVENKMVSTIIDGYRNRGLYEIGEYDAKAIMQAYGFTIPQGTLGVTSDDAVAFANKVGYPLVMKIASQDILHKSDVGGVKVGLSSAAEVKDAYETMMIRVKQNKPDAVIQGVVIEKMFQGGKEVILGMKRDPQFGAMIMFGLGGIFVEILKDVTFGLAPLSSEDCKKMIESVKSYKLLQGARGEKPVDIDSIVVNLQKLSQLVIDFPDIEEIDLNPVKVGLQGEGSVVVDARVIIKKNKIV